ncbi:MAG: LysR family transcriptional regulator [Opitutaceae bacterium]|jgi:LysR family hydrogen peroxide-inducible transcriptional activator|nr:LysR family transcriptional regulator [Opitutaceae bacterium]
MEIYQLRYLIAVAETGNFTRASERCFVSQPSLSQQIINLESELGHKLFHRLGRKTVPTEAGELFIERARRILFEVETATKEIQDNPSQERRITVGAVPSVMPYWLPPLILEAARRFPGLVVNTMENLSQPLIKAVVDGVVDLALISMPVKDHHVSAEILFREPLLLVVPKSNPLATKPEVTALDLANETFVLLGHSSGLASQIQRFCGDHDFEPRIGHNCTQLRTVKSLVAVGAGISILPKSARTSVDPVSLVYRKLSGRTPYRELALVRHLQRYQSHGANQFITLLRENLPAM